MITINLDLNNMVVFKEEISLCLGYFDGLHIGHLELINKAKSSIYKSALLTFSSLNKRSELITSFFDKQEILKKQNIDYLFVLKFNEELKSLTPEEFIEKVLIKLNAKEIIIGKDYSFGKNKSGNALTLKKHHEFKTIVVPFVKFNNHKISTTYILKCLEKGNMEIVSKCLNRNYKVKGLVIKGNGKGHLINYPTLNLKLSDNYKLPHKGVYKGYTYYKENKYLSMINVGVHPTILRLDKEIIEVHLIDENINLYGEEIEVEFVSFIRDEIKFASINELKNQLDKDKLNIKNM